MQTSLILKRYLKHVTQASLDILGSAVRGPTGEEALGEPEEEEVDKLFIDGKAVSRARGRAAITTTITVTIIMISTITIIIIKIIIENTPGGR